MGSTLRTTDRDRLQAEHSSSAGTRQLVSVGMSALESPSVTAGPDTHGLEICGPKHEILLTFIRDSECLKIA